MLIEKWHDDMQTVYRLETELANDPDYLHDAQQLTLDTSRPFLGLRGTHGLFGSEQWWDNVRNGKLPTVYHTGIVAKAYHVGQDKGKFNNAIDLIKENGEIISLGIFVNRPADAALFQKGHRVIRVDVLDELKRQPAADGGINYLNITLQMAVSLRGGFQPSVD